jgi:hypothetical protein
MCRCQTAQQFCGVVPDGDPVVGEQSSKRVGGRGDSVRTLADQRAESFDRVVLDRLVFVTTP